ncbi:lysozyme inhibitor LprI family protein [Niallia sp. Krafla_26]|uniref:lysozyme inhibitor LprI family protein n=1 Tax=Niallia sp. Krafla_26 TaxID=3064703 RepID=UPI003D1783C6
MGQNRSYIMVIFAFFLIILAGCGNPSDETSTQSENISSNNNATQIEEEELKNDVNDREKDSTGNPSEDAIKNPDDTIETNKQHENQKEYQATKVPEKEKEPASTHTEESLKEDYLTKLNNAKKEVEDLEATDSSTFALKKVENDRWEIWDGWLNDIYGVLQKQLPPDEMEALRNEQRNWIKNRDDRALEASLKFKGGTQEHLEYVSVLANLTEERCYELVEKYMK